MYNVDLVFYTAIKIALNIQIKKDTKTLKIGISGNDKSGKNEIMYKYVNHKNEEFTKIFEYKNDFFKIKYDPYANYLSDVDAIIFLFDVADKGSFEYAKRRIISAYLSNAKNIKYYLAANFTEKRKQIEFQNQIIHYDEIIKAWNELNCDIFEINPNCDEDEYAMLYYIISKLPKPMKEKKIKRKKDKSHGKTSKKNKK